MPYANLEDILADFNNFEGEHDESFEQSFLHPRLHALHPEATFIRFCGGHRCENTDSFRDRTVQAWKATKLLKTYKYGRI